MFTDNLYRIIGGRIDFAFATFSTNWCVVYFQNALVRSLFVSLLCDLLGGLVGPCFYRTSRSDLLGATPPGACR